MNRGHLATLLSLGALLTSIIVLGLLSLPKMKEERVRTPQSEGSPTGIAYRDFVKNAAAKAYHSANDNEAERKRNWEENFPFKPTYDQSMVYNPDLYDSQRPDLNRTPGDPSWEAQRMAVQNHGILKGFFGNAHRFSREFEQLYGKLEGHDRVKDPRVIAGIFSNLVDYQKAVQQDPKSLWHFERVDVSSRSEDGTRPRLKVAIDGVTTWGDRQEALRESIATRLYSPRVNPGTRQMTIEEAWELADEIIHEIATHELLNIPQHENYTNPSDPSLAPGDPLLIPYEGYQEDYTAWERSEDRRMAAQRAILAQDNLKLTPDGQVKNPSTGERLFGGADILIRAPGEKEFVPILPSGQ